MLEIHISNLEEDLLTYFRSNVGYSDITAKTQQGEWGIKRITLKFPVLNAFTSPLRTKNLHRSLAGKLSSEF